MGRGIDDALIRLMRDQPRNILRFQLIAFHQLGADIGHALDGKLENGLSFLVDIMLFGRYRLVRRWPQGATGLHMEMVTTAAIAFQDAVQHAITVVIRFQQDPAGAITKNDTGRPVAVVDNAAHLVRSYDDDLFEPPALDIHRP